MDAPLEVRVSLDIGAKQHFAAIGLSNGDVLSEFSFDHKLEGFNEFFDQVDKQKVKYKADVSVAMEGYNGWASPLDKLIIHRGFRLFNMNSLKLKRFKEVFPSPAKSDEIDARKGLELFQLQGHLPLAKKTLQEVTAVSDVNDRLKILTRRRRRLVNEKVSYINTLHSDLQSLLPGITEMTTKIDNVWFLSFLLKGKSLKDLPKLSEKKILSIRGVGKSYAEKIMDWQKQYLVSPTINWEEGMVLIDLERILFLRDHIKDLEHEIEVLTLESEEGMIIKSIPGYGKTCAAELAGEIGSIERFEKESSLAIYLGMAPLDNSSGSYAGSKQPKSVNTRAKFAMMAAVDKHRKYVEQSGIYYQKKRTEGKKHNQAIRCLGRQMIRVIFKLLTEKREYTC